MDLVNIPKYCLSCSEKELQNIIRYEGYSAIMRFSELVSIARPAGTVWNIAPLCKSLTTLAALHCNCKALALAVRGLCAYLGLDLTVAKPSSSEESE
ncbi:hypothetical protein ALC60_11842 [Trachymyrmex zeteki]|uniref:Uncharacterized protein n=1 Tax=Mycetomoellerius zeteki TaxID=64791 RepID=A0A151WN51_9HYME|nr:hypothetical protein ALC60_11842 [Trachymyrmex zeteki]